MEPLASAGHPAKGSRLALRLNRKFSHGSVRGKGVWDGISSPQCVAWVVSAMAAETGLAVGPAPPSRPRGALAPHHPGPTCHPGGSLHEPRVSAHEVTLPRGAWVAQPVREVTPLSIPPSPPVSARLPEGTTGGSPAGRAWWHLSENVHSPRLLVSLPCPL